MGKEYKIGSFEEKLKMDYRSVFTLQPAQPVIYFELGLIYERSLDPISKKGSCI